MDGKTIRYMLADSSQFLDLPADVAVGEPSERIFMLVRGEACRLWKTSTHMAARQKLVGRVVKEGFTGRGWCILVEIAGVTIEVWERAPSGLKHGETVELSVDVDHVQLLQAQ